MNKSESIAELTKALVKVQGALTPAAKDAQNPFFKSSYSSLNSVWDSCRKLLSDNGLAVTQLNQVCENGVIIETVLLHSSGEWLSGEIFLPLTKHDAQSVGSASSYGRRYGLAAIVGIVSDEDDDGNSASQPRQQARPAQKPTQKPLSERIRNVTEAIKEQGGTVEAKASTETEQEYFESLVDQWNRLQK